MLKLLLQPDERVVRHHFPEAELIETCLGHTAPGAPGPAQSSSSLSTAGWSLSWCLKACHLLLHVASASSNQVLPHFPSLLSHLQPHLFLPPESSLLFRVHVIRLGLPG